MTTALSYVRVLAWPVAILLCALIIGQPWRKR